MATAFCDQLNADLDALVDNAADVAVIERRAPPPPPAGADGGDLGLGSVARAFAGDAQFSELFAGVALDAAVGSIEDLDLDDLAVDDLDLGVDELDLDVGGGGGDGGGGGGDLDLDLDLDMDLGLEELELDGGDGGDGDLDLDLDMDLPDVGDLPDVEDIDIDEIDAGDAAAPSSDAAAPAPVPLPQERSYSLLPASRRAPSGKIRKKEENLDATSDAYTFKVEEEKGAYLVTTPRKEDRDLTAREPTEGMEKFVLTVYVSGGTSKKIAATLDFTMKDLTMVMAKKLDLWQTEFFSMCKQTSNGGDCWIAEGTTLEDLGYATDKIPLYLKIKYIKWPIKLVDDKALQLFYLQIKDCVVSGTWPCSHKLSILLAAHQLQETSGDFKPFQHRPGYLGDQGIRRYLPEAVIATAPTSYLEDRMYQSYQRLTGMTQREAMHAYVKHAQSIQTYGSTTFLVKDTTGKSRKLAIAEDGVFFSIEKSIDKFDFYSFKRLTGWQADAADPISVSIEIQNPSATIAVSAADVAEASLIIELLCAYYTFLLEVDPTDLPLVRLPMRPSDMPNPLYFEKPNSLLKRNLSDQTYSRLELFKELYIDGLRAKKILPCEKLLLQLDDCIDQEIVLESLSLVKTGTGAPELVTITDAILGSMHYEPRASEFFEENMALATIDLSRNPFAKHSEGLDALGKMLAAPHFKLKHLRISGCKLTFKHIDALGKYLSENKWVESIDLERNDIRDKGVSGIVKPLKGQENACSFNFNDNNLTSQVCFLLAQMLAKNPHVAELYIGHNKIDDKGISHIMEGIKRNKSLTTFDISKTQFSANAGRTLIKLLEGSFMKNLYVSHNKLGSSWGAALVKVLNAGSSLQLLHVENTGIGAKNTKGLLESMKVNRGLKDLVLSGNEIDKKGVRDLVDVLRSNHPVRSLGLSKCGFSKTLMSDIAVSLESNVNVTKLDISGNALKIVDAAEAWAHMLSATKTIEDLDLSGCGIAGDILTALLPGIARNRSLKRLNLSEQKIATAGYEELGKALAQNSTLQWVGLANTAADGGTFAQFLKVVDGGNFSLREMDARGNKGLSSNKDWESMLSKVHFTILY